MGVVATCGQISGVKGTALMANLHLSTRSETLPRGRRFSMKGATFWAQSTFPPGSLLQTGRSGDSQARLPLAPTVGRGVGGGGGKKGPSEPPWRREVFLGPRQRGQSAPCPSRAPARPAQRAVPVESVLWDLRP